MFFVFEKCVCVCCLSIAPTRKREHLNKNLTSWTAEKLHKKVCAVLMGKVNPSTDVDVLDNSEDILDFSNPLAKSKSIRYRRTNESLESKLNNIASQYHTTIRGYMMHVLTNAISNLIQNAHLFPLLPQPKCFTFMTRDFLLKIAEDIAGATRPPTASFGTAHEATHAVKFLHLIASYSEEGFDAVHGTLIGYGSRNKKRQLMEFLERAYDAGLSCHHVLKVEAMIVRNILKGRASMNQH